MISLAVAIASTMFALGIALWCGKLAQRDGAALRRLRQELPVETKPAESGLARDGDAVAADLFSYFSRIYAPALRGVVTAIGPHHAALGSVGVVGGAQAVDWENLRVMVVPGIHDPLSASSVVTGSSPSKEEEKTVVVQWYSMTPPAREIDDEKRSDPAWFSGGLGNYFANAKLSSPGFANEAVNALG